MALIERFRSKEIDEDSGGVRGLRRFVIEYNEERLLPDLGDRWPGETELRVVRRKIMPGINTGTVHETHKEVEVHYSSGEFSGTLMTASAVPRVFQWGEPAGATWSDGTAMEEAFNVITAQVALSWLVFIGESSGFYLQDWIRTRSRFIGSVNSAPFQGYQRGTLLLTGVNLRDTWNRGRRAAEANLTAIYQPQGWDHAWDKDTLSWRKYRPVPYAFENWGMLRPRRPF